MMMKSTINTTGKILSPILLLCFLFWVLVKIPAIGSSQFFMVFYESGWLQLILATIACTLYFVYQWVRNKFKFNYYFYNVILGLVTLVIIFDSTIKQLFF